MSLHHSSGFPSAQTNFFYSPTGLIPHTNLYCSEFSRKPKIKHLATPFQEQVPLFVDRAMALVQHYGTSDITLCHPASLSPSLPSRQVLWPALHHGLSPNPQWKLNVLNNKRLIQQRTGLIGFKPFKCSSNNYHTCICARKSYTFVPFFVDFVY